MVQIIFIITNDGDLKQVVFVPENKNTFQSEIKTGEPFHSDYIIDYKGKIIIINLFTLNLMMNNTD